MSFGTEEDLLELVPGRSTVRLRVRLEPFEKLGLVGRTQIALEHELDLLRHALPHDRVVPVEAQRERFAVQDLVEHVAVDQRIAFRGRRRALRGSLETRRQGRDPVGIDDDLIRRFAGVVVDEAEQQEKRDTERKEVNQGLAQQVVHGFFPG